MSAGFSTLNITQLAPLCFQDRFDSSPVLAGQLIATSMAVNIPMNLVTGGIESLLMRSGVPLLRIRQLMSSVAALGAAAASLLYGTAQRPATAMGAMAIYFISHQFNNSGFFPNFQELGGVDASLLTSTANTLASSAAVLVAPISVALRRLTGGWRAQYLVSAALLAGTGLFYAASLSVEPARELLARRAGKPQLGGEEGERER